ncbi:hypothetical protein PMAYCL1PPCAC_16991, partial [Pristionchus mayeri]
GNEAYILNWYIPMWLATTCFELGISVERGAETIEAALGTILSNLIDIGAFSTNIIVFLFARRMNKADHKQLNERYQASLAEGFVQIRETYSIAKTMMPVYCLSTSLKAIMMVMNWMYVAVIIPHTVTQFVYMSV